MSDKEQKNAGVSRRVFLKKSATVGVGATALSGLGSGSAEAQDFWDMSADLVSIGAGTAGLAAAVSALNHGASVIMVEENVDIGGHGMCSGGQVHLGGGTSNQRKFGVEDSADQVFLDWIRHDHASSRYSDIRILDRERGPIPGPPDRSNGCIDSASSAAKCSVAGR